MRGARATALALALCAPAASVALPAARAHNGFGIAPIFSEPRGLVVLDEPTTLTLRWTSSEAHPELAYRMKAQAADLPPTPSPPSTLRAGTLLSTLSADALSYSHTLDLSSLPSGAWRLYAEHDEPPTCVELVQAPALLVVRRAGDPPPFGVLVTAPLDDSPIVDASAEVRLEAISSEPVTVTLEAGTITRDPAFPPRTLCVEFTWQATLGVVAADLPMVADAAAGPDRWRLDWTWDTRAVPSDAYLLRVTARTATRSEIVWARRWVNVEHPGSVDAGPDAPPEAAPEAPPEVGGDVAEAPSAPGDDGCAAGATTAWSLLVGLALAARRRGMIQTRASSRSR